MELFIALSDAFKPCHTQKIHQPKVNGCWLALCSKLCERNLHRKTVQFANSHSTVCCFGSAIAVKAKQPGESVPTRVSLSSVQQCEFCDQENNNETQSQTHYLCCACGDSLFCGARVRTSFRHWLVDG